MDVNGTQCATIRNSTVEIVSESFRQTLLRQIQSGNETVSTSYTLRAPMPGLIVKLLCDEGTVVQSGDGVLVVEAMKMENEIKAPKNGIMKKLFVKERQSVEKNDQLFTIDNI